MTYYEYWYNDSNLQAQMGKRDFNEVKKHIMQQQMDAFKAKSANPTHASDSLALQDFLELRRQNSAYWASQAQEAIWGGSITSGSKIGSGDLSYQGMAMATTSMSAGDLVGAELAALTRQLINDLETITTTTNELWQTLVQRLEMAEPAVAAAVLEQAANGVVADADMLNQILSRTGRQAKINVAGLSKGQASLAQQFANLQELVAILPTLGSAKVPNLGRGSGRGKLIATILGKIGGNFTYLSSQVGKIASGQGLLQSDREFAKAFKQTIASNKSKTISTGLFTINMNQYEHVQVPKTFTANASVGTGQVIVTEGGVVLSAGGEIPEKQPRSISVGSTPINIWDTFSLQTAINYAISWGHIKKYYVYELATVDTEELETGLGKGHAGGDAGVLEEQWHNVAEFAAYAYFVKKVMKEKLQLEPDTFYVIGNQVMTPARLMQHIQQNANSITISNIPGREMFRSMNRNGYWQGTRKYYRRAEARARSSMIENSSMFANNILMARLNAIS